MYQSNDSFIPEAGHLDGASEDGTTGSTGVTEADPPATAQSSGGVAAGLRPGFLAELAVAMRATAEKEREHIAARVSEDAAAHVDKVRARAAIETDELKRLAEEDVQHIEEWSAAEMERIRSEADKKIEDRRASLEEYLKQHDSIIDSEIDGVNQAVTEYNATLDRFFEELSQSDDPSTIVARAEALPAPPDLDQVRAQARARAVAQLADVDEPAAADTAPVAQASVAPEAPLAAAVATPDAPADVAAPPATGVAESPVTPDATVDSIVSAEALDASDGPGAMPETPTAEETARIGDLPTEDAPSTPGSASVESAPVAAPIPVMDPVATADSSWPAPATAPEPEPVAAAVDHTSAAVRLLRSVAPWTAPTHPGPNDRSESE